MTEAEVIERIDVLMNHYNHTLVTNQQFLDRVYAIMREYHTAEAEKS